jgi:YVTN family beta-propeller protein
VVATVPLPPDLTPGYTEVSPDGSQLWVAESPYLASKWEIVVIDIKTNTISHTLSLPVNSNPGAMVFAPNGKRAYVSNFDNSAFVVNVAMLKVVATIDTLGSVNGLAVSPDGTMLALPNTGTSRAGAFDQSTATQLANIPVGSMLFGSQLYLEYGGAAVSADGSRAYVTNYASNNVSVIDTATKRVLTSVPAGSSPVGVVVSPDGSKAYVANSYSNTVTVINTNMFTTKTISMPQNTYPSSIAIAPDGKHVYLAGDNVIPDFGTARCYIFVMDTGTNQVTASIRIPYPMAVAASPDGTKVYAVGGSTTLYTISTATNTITATLQLENGGAIQPITSGIAVTPDGTKVFADDAFGNNVYEVDATQNKLLGTIKAGTVSGIMAVTPDGSQLWVGDYMGTAVTVVDVATFTVSNTIPLGNQSYGIAFGPK